MRPEAGEPAPGSTVMCQGACAVRAGPSGAAEVVARCGGGDVAVVRETRAGWHRVGRGWSPRSAWAPVALAKRAVAAGKPAADGAYEVRFDDGCGNRLRLARARNQLSFNYSGHGDEAAVPSLSYDGLRTVCIAGVSVTVPWVHLPLAVAALYRIVQGTRFQSAVPGEYSVPVSIRVAEGTLPVPRVAVVPGVLFGAVGGAAASSDGSATCFLTDSSECCGAAAGGAGSRPSSGASFAAAASVGGGLLHEPDGGLELLWPMSPPVNHAVIPVNSPVLAHEAGPPPHPAGGPAPRSKHCSGISSGGGGGGAKVRSDMNRGSNMQHPSTVRTPSGATRTPGQAGQGGGSGGFSLGPSHGSFFFSDDEDGPLSLEHSPLRAPADRGSFGTEAVSRAATVPPGGPAASSSGCGRRRFRNRLLSFFQFYRPEKLPSVAPTMARAARGHEESIMRRLADKYGPEPRDIMSDRLRPGWRQVETEAGDVFYVHAGGDKQWVRPSEFLNDCTVRPLLKGTLPRSASPSPTLVN